MYPTIMEKMLVFSNRQIFGLHQGGEGKEKLRKLLNCPVHYKSWNSGQPSSSDFEPGEKVVYLFCTRYNITVAILFVNIAFKFFIFKSELRESGSALKKLILFC